MALHLQRWWRLIFLVACGVMLRETPAFAQKQVRRPGLHSFGVFVDPSGPQQAASYQNVLTGSSVKVPVTIEKSLESAAASDAGVLVLVIDRMPETIPEETITALKNRKVIGVGYGAAQLFGQLGLEINGDACAHFGMSEIKVQLQPSQLLGDLSSRRPLSVYAKDPGDVDNFGVFIPKTAELVEFVDPIARETNDPNYSPVIRQGSYVLVGYPADPEFWSEDFRTLFLRIALTLSEKKPQELAQPEFKLSQPGTQRFDLARRGSTDKAFTRTFRFRFKQPTKFSATLEHSGSGNMMLFFMGGKEHLHLTRRDAKDGEKLQIEAQITAADLKAIGDQTWTLSVTNFDSDAEASATLKVDYGGP